MFLPNSFARKLHLLFSLCELLYRSLGTRRLLLPRTHKDAKFSVKSDKSSHVVGIRISKLLFHSPHPTPSKFWDLPAAHQASFTFCESNIACNQCIGFSYCILITHGSLSNLDNRSRLFLSPRQVITLPKRRFCKRILLLNMCLKGSNEVTCKRVMEIIHTSHITIKGDFMWGMKNRTQSELLGKNKPNGIQTKNSYLVFIEISNNHSNKKRSDQSCSPGIQKHEYRFHASV